ncbi:MAG: hypothetical protein EU548_10270 [Promethearchaeota archaeon]|nr:MAG: hypothetical protein EU548_10270 [Candidatus Lokiarchaeota archaeon]
METREIKSKFEGKLLIKANVLGVMTGYKVKGKERTEKLSIVCLVEKKLPKEKLNKKDIIPEIIKEIPTDVIEVGKIRALQTNNKEKYRPSPMGTSGGHYLITAGTNGELIKDKDTGKIGIGTNNHVGANSNDAEIGDAYLQPGTYDGGNIPDDIIGNLYKFVPIEFVGSTSSCSFAKFWSNLYNIPARLLGRDTRLKPIVAYPEHNLVDAAMIEVERKDVLSKILDIGKPKGVKQARLDMLVQKSGRTTSRTVNGVVTGIDATIGPISYGSGKTAYFRDQIVISKKGFSSGGDSGSLILDMDGYAVGKLFAGSDINNITIANHIQNYLDMLNAELVIE